MERVEQDPDRLAELFELDHMAARMRRNNASLLVFAGADTVRSQHEPASVVDVLRAAQSEVEHYTRIELAKCDGTIEVASRVVNDLVHMVAELFDNATAFSPPDTYVAVQANRMVDGGAWIQITDRGIGMSEEQHGELNRRLAVAPYEVNASLTRMMGIAVVGRLAARHGITVELRSNPTGGTCVDITLPAHTLAWRYSADEHSS
jgi:signal transduction histidine kinase